MLGSLRSTCVVSIAALLVAGPIACGDGGDGGAGGASSSSVGPGGGAGGGAGGGGASSTSSTGPGGGGEELVFHPGELVGTPLVRYFIDEAASGTEPAELVDAADSPLPLTLVYEGGMRFFEGQPGRRGLRLDAAGLDDRAQALVDGTKLTQLQASRTATIELVLEVTGADSNRSRISHLGFDFADNVLSVATASTGMVDIYFNLSRVHYAGLDWATLGRSVVHAVVDTDQEEPTDRVRLYVNGAPVAAHGGSTPALGSGLDLGVGRYYVLANREIGQRTFAGTLYYAAMYVAALSPAEVLQNAQLLLATDDRAP